MRDEELREEFAVWLRPVREAEPPGLPVLRRRLRRRRTRHAVAGTTALAAVAGLAVAIGTVLGPPAPSGPLATTGPQTAGPQATGTQPTGSLSAIPVTTSSPRPVSGGYQASAAYEVSGPVSTLVVSSQLGQVTITGSQRSTVSVTEQIRYSASPPAMTRVVTGKTLTLGASCPNEQMCAASYDIQVPRDVAVRVSSSNGDIRLFSLAGAVNASSDLGSITADGLTSGSASFASNLGGIDATFAAAPASVHATSDLGNISIHVPGNVSYDVSAPAGNLGSATVSVPQSASSPHVIDATGNMGSIVIAPASP